MDTVANFPAECNDGVENWQAMHAEHLERWKQWESLYDLGFNMVPCSPDKSIFYDKWKHLQDERLPKRKFFDWKKEYTGFRQCGMFLITGDTPVMKVVVMDADEQLARDLIEDNCEPTPLWVQRLSAPHKRHYYYRHPGEDIKTVKKIKYRDQWYALDIRGDGGGIFAPYGPHNSGDLYLPSQPITRELIESLPVYDPTWIPYTASGGRDRTSVATGFNLATNEDHESMVQDESLPSLERRKERATAYLKKVPGTQSGNGEAENRCYCLAGKIALGFALPAQDAVELMFNHWAEKDDQTDENGHHYPWTYAQIAHKVSDAIANREGYPGQFAEMYDEKEQEYRYTAEEIDAIIKDRYPDDTPEEKKVTLDTLSDHELYGYLWRGNHVLISDDERRRRLRSIHEVVKLIPKKGFFFEWLKLMLPTTDAAPIYHLGAALATAGHLVNRKAGLRFGNQTVLPNMWVGILGQSSLSRKTSSINAAKAQIAKLEDYKHTTLNDSFTFEGLMVELGHIVKAADGEVGESDLEVMRMKNAQREQACREAGTDYTKGVGLFHSNEIGAWLNTLNKTQNAGLKETLTEWYDCPPDWSKKTKTQGTYYVDRPCPSILGASTVEWLVNQTDEADLKSGFLARWLFFDSTSKDYIMPIPDEPDPDQQEAVQLELRHLTSQRGMLTLKPGTEAFAHYWDWSKEVARTAGGNSIVESWVARLSVYALKIALLYEASTADRLDEISLSSMKLATALIDHLIVVLKETLGSFAHSANGKAINKVRDLIKKTKKVGITRSKLLKDFDGHAKELDDIMKTLQERGDVVIQVEPAKNGKDVTRYIYVG